MMFGSFIVPLMYKILLLRKQDEHAIVIDSSLLPVGLSVTDSHSRKSLKLHQLRLLSKVCR